MSESPKVSIVLPTFNGSSFIRRSIDSCLNQTHSNIELILVDDCSTDGTPQILASYKDPRIRRIRNASNQRLPRSLNIGFRHAAGEYLTWTSDDNEYLPDAIEKMLHCLCSQPRVNFVYADYWALDEAAQKKEKVLVPDRLDFKEGNKVGGCFLYTRRVYESVGRYNPHLEMVEDYDYFIRICEKFGSRRCPTPIYIYRTHSGSLTTTRHYNQDLFDKILKYRNGYISLPGLGWTGVYYLENVLKSGLSRKEKRLLLSRTLGQLAALSLPLTVLLFPIIACYWIRKNVREWVARKPAIKTR